MPGLAPRIVEKGLASDRVVVETVVARYCDHLPLYRQERILEREAGVEISRATLDGWVMRVGELLEPVMEAMREDLLRGSYIQADETVVPVQMRDGGGTDHQAYLWQYGTPGGETVFDFQMGRGRDGPAKFLKGWNGILQTDGYRAYDGVGGSGVIHVGCWAHARRKFVDAVKVNPKDGAAIGMVTRMDALFLVDRHARRERMSVEERGAMQREHARTWVEEIHAECLTLRGRVLPRSVLGEAVNYTLNMWTKLERCLDHAAVELSNNVAENSMRPVALGRKNWLHVGGRQLRSESGGDTFGGGILPPPATAGEGLPARCAARDEREEAIGTPPVHPGSLDGRSRLRWVGLTDTNDLATVLAVKGSLRRSAPLTAPGRREKDNLI
jgi:hypothetical protein